MTLIELYSIAQRATNAHKVDDVHMLIPLLEDMKQNEKVLFARLCMLIKEYKTSLAERICDSRQYNLFGAEDEASAEDQD